MAVSPPSPLSRENSCTFLRLLFALMVVWGHAYVLPGTGEEPLARLTGGALSGRELAVQCFFVLSGFLIAKSLAEHSSLWRFACHRAFRIFPAFWVYLCAMVFLVTPWLLEQRWPDRYGYWQLLNLGPLSAWHYFVHNWGLQVKEFLIAPLFANNHARFQVNGSLWSVHYEAIFYICAAAGAGAWQLPRRLAWLVAGLSALATILLGWKGLAFVTAALVWRAIVPRGWGVLALFVSLYFVEALIAFQPSALAVLPEEFVLWFTWVFHPLWRISGLAFLGGMLCWRYRAYLRWDFRAFAIAAGVFLAGVLLHQWRLAMPLALPYLVLFLAARLPFQKVERWGDASYGIYIFSFPIQQLLMSWGLHRQGFVAFLAGSIGLSVVAGMLSWWLVEKPALRLGRKLGDWSPWRRKNVDVACCAAESPAPARQ